MYFDQKIGDLLGPVLAGEFADPDEFTQMAWAWSMS